MAKLKTYKRKSSKRVLRQPREREYNFLKYWRVVRYYIRKKYNITGPEHDLLLYFYDMPYFKKEDFVNYQNLMSWDRRRFVALKRKGLIHEFRRGGDGGRAALFELTPLAKSICRSTYKKLLDEEPISEVAKNNPVFKRETYTDRVYSNMIKKMNASRDARIFEQRSSKGSNPE